MNFRKIYPTVVLLLTLGWPQLASAQTEPDRLTAHFDRPFYVVGDDAWFKIYFLNANPPLSKVVHAEWLSPDGKVVHRQKLRVESRAAAGDFTIPLDWKEGFYLFRAYTTWSLNFDTSFICQKIVPIYNDFNAPPNAGATSTALAATIDNQSFVAQGLKIDLNQTVFNPQSAVKFSIKSDATDAIAALSVSVTDANLPLSNAAFWPSQNVSAAAVTVPKEPKYPVETGLGISATVKNPLKNAPLNDRYVSVYTAANRRFQRASIVKNRLQANLPDVEGTTLLQILSLNPTIKKPLFFELDDYSDVLPAYRAQGALRRTPDVERYLVQNRLRRKVNQVFGLPSNAAAQEPKNALPPLRPNRSYPMNSLQDIATVNEFFREVLLSSYTFTSDSGTRSLRFINQDDSKSPYLPFEPFYSVDGRFITNEDAVFDFPLLNFSKIDIFDRKNEIKNQLDSLMFRHGVVIMQSSPTAKKNIFDKLGGHAVTFEGFYPTRQFDASTPSVENGRTPDFRPVLYWNPTATSDATLQFSTGDVVGKYRLRVVGVTQSGQPVYAETQFEVKPSAPR